MKSKVITFVLFLFFVVSKAYSNDFVLLETLISAHKKQYNLLNERKNNESANITLYTNVKKLTNEYDDFYAKIGKRFKQGYELVLFAQEVVEIQKLSTSSGRVLIELGELAFKNTTKHPFVMAFYYGVYDSVIVETKTCINIVKLLLTTRATNKQKFDWINQIKTSLVYIDYILNRCKDQIEYCIFLNVKPKNFSDLMKNDAFKKNADKIINDMKKLKH